MNLSFYNTETSYDKNVRGSIREDMENQAYDLRLSTIEESNDFSFAQYNNTPLKMLITI